MTYTITIMICKLNPFNLEVIILITLSIISLNCISKYMKQHHRIEIFSGNCPLCTHVVEDIQIGRCEGCKQIVYDINNMNEDVKAKMKNYGIKAVPTTIIDGSIKIVGIPDFPWICGEELFQKLKRDYT